MSTTRAVAFLVVTVGPLVALTIAVSPHDGPARHHSPRPAATR